ncbi:MAG: protein translocase subunit SecD [Chloroflexi bacterium]|nr:protein translocase subunit SecD [Chloroflexota bacterium]
MSRRNLQFLTAIAAITLISLWVTWPKYPERFLPGFVPWPSNDGVYFCLGDSCFDRRDLRLGLDLQGGTQIVLEADVSQRPAQDRAGAVEGVKRIIERRINAYGVTEPLIQIQGSNRISVQLPGVKDIQEAIRLIGQTAQLDFREQVVTDTSETQWVKAKARVDSQEKELTGAYLKPNAAVIFESQTSQPQVSFEFNDEGAGLFEQITTRLIGKPLGIFLDDELVSAPTVRAVIRERGIIEGLDINEARVLAIQLNAGALPVPVHIVQQQDVDAMLGADSIRKSVVAGQVGLGIVLLFMLLYYRLPGLMAGLALLIYTVLVLAIFKLIPVTLTLAGIAAFILSIGMAVDANILIFERTKEEVRWGRSLGSAIEAGFDRAWSSIRDSNISTIITCAILYWFGSNFGASLVMGFAVTLFIGVAVSMFTAITVSRTFMRLLVSTGLARRTHLFGIPGPEIVAAKQQAQQDSRELKRGY